MYEEQELRRRQARRREQLRRQKLRRKVRICVSLVVIAVVLVAAANFISGLGGIRETGFGELLAKITGANRDDGAVSVSYVDADKADLVYPQVREEDEVLRQLKTLAKEKDAYTEIVENYDDYPEELLAALCNNEEMLPFVQGYLKADGQARGGLTKEEKEVDIPLLLQWDERWGYVPYGESNIALSGCAPTCLSMVIVSLTGDSTATPDAIAAYAMENGFYLEGTGTAWAIMTDGVAHYGVKGTELSLDESVVKKHLEAGEPIICSMRPGDFTTGGHFIVLTSVVDGKITVHDPNSRKRSSVLWDYDTLASQIKNLWAFTEN